MMSDEFVTAQGASVDASEVERFSRIAAEWWDPRGKFAPLHKFNPVRLSYIRETLVRHFSLDEASAAPLTGLRMLDIGCGGGLLSEPMARLGASMVSVDPSHTNINVAKLHAAQSGLAIDYRAATAEDLVASGELFDVVLNMEVVEHVADVGGYLAATAKLVKPGGLMVLATLNRTPKALALAIVGAEYVLRWVPRGTHQYSKFVKPDEAAGPLEAAGLTIIERVGVSYSPFADRWSLSGDLDVNYMLLAARAV
jgi:2-polyprenyl-6-hydroxyphenyl methylase/3-demethylubiquinone-9 3-methyltransferase